MEESKIAEELFRRSFIVAMMVGILCRFIVLRVKDHQYPSRPQDYLEQLIISALSSSLGAVAFPALIDKEFSALTFFAVAIQQFQGLSKQERITIENIDKTEIVPKGVGYIEDICSTYESRSYISLTSSLVASVCFIRGYKVHNLGYFWATILAVFGGAIVGLIFRRYLRRDSIGDFADVVVAKISFDGPNLKVNNVFIENIGLKDTRKRYMDKALAVEIKPKDMRSFGIISDDSQRQAILHNIFINLGIDKDVDEKDILSISRVDLENKTVVIPYIPLINDIDKFINVIKSTPIIEYAKGKSSAYQK